MPNMSTPKTTLKERISKQYNLLWEDALKNFKRGTCKIDKLIDDRNDTRMGVSLLLRPKQKIIKQIQLFLSEVKKIEPHQYLYPDTDIHVTISSIISAHENFSLTEIDQEKFISVINKSLLNIPAFQIDFSGVTANSNTIMIKGYPLNEKLQLVREQLKKNFEKLKLDQHMDPRYDRITAHCTVVRFREPLVNPSELIILLKKFQEKRFGINEVDEVEFVLNDWYQRKKLSPTLATFQLSHDVLN